jgi:ribosomal protein L44E
MKLARWKCPTCSAGNLAPRRPRRDDVRKYCLPCSEKTGRLVEKVCAALEGKREVAKQKQRAKQKKERAILGFKKPMDYYDIAGINVRVWLDMKGIGSNIELLVRETKRPGPIKIKHIEGWLYVVTIRKGDWVTRADVEAQLALASAKVNWLRVNTTTPLTSPKALEYMRNICSHHLGVRPRLNAPAKAEIEVANMLRKLRAVETLTETLKRTA